MLLSQCASDDSVGGIIRPRPYAGVTHMFINALNPAGAQVQASIIHPGLKAASPVSIFQTFNITVLL